MDVVLLALEHLLAPELAGKIVLSLTVLLLPGGAWWFLRQANRGHEWLALFAGLICYDVFFIEGFVNFQLALGVALLLAGFWQRERARAAEQRGAGGPPGSAVASRRWWPWALLFFWAMLLYLTHLIVFGLVAIALTLAALGSNGVSDETGSFLCRAGRRLRRALPTALLFVPGCLLFLLMRPGLSQRSEFGFRYLRDKVDSFYQVPTHGFSDSADTAILALLALAVLLAVVKNKELRANGCWPWVWLALAMIYFAMPLSWGQTYDIDVRSLPLLFLVGLCTFRLGRRRMQAVALVAAMVLAVRVADVAAGFRREIPLMNSLAESVADIPVNARVLPLVEVAEDNDPILRPFGHYWAYATIRRGAFSPYLFDIPGQMPLRITSAPYAPDGFWDLRYQVTPDWPTVRNQYDFIWAYNVERFAPAIAGIADPVYHKESLVLYRIRKQEIKVQRQARHGAVPLGS
jgi:hypothetical protein